MTKKKALTDVSYIQKMFNKHNYKIVIRDVEPNGDEGYLFIDCDIFIETCNDYSLNPLEVFKALEKDVVYAFHKEDTICEYFILWNKPLKFYKALNFGW